LNLKNNNNNNYARKTQRKSPPNHILCNCTTHSLTLEADIVRSRATSALRSGDDTAGAAWLSGRAADLDDCSMRILEHRLFFTEFKV
jgi:hypothetical protein